MNNAIVDNVDKDESYLKNFDFDAVGVQKIKHPLIQEAQNRALLADDVADWLSKQTAATRQHVNAVIRHLMALITSNQ